jgi:hypothetical protein
MKRIGLLTTLSLFLFAISVHAQIPGVSKVTKALPKVDLGVKVGANFQELSGNLSSQYRGGVVGGIFVGLHKNRMGVQVEGLVKTVSYDLKVLLPTMPPIATYASANINAISLEVPVLFEYKIFWHIWAQAGPEFSSILSAKDGSTDYKNHFDASDFGAVIGLEAHLPMKLNIGARYIYGVTNINNESVSGVAGSMKNRTAQIYVGFRFI